MGQFSSVEGIPWSEIKESVNFQVEDEGAISQETTTFLNKKAVMRVHEDDTREPLGLVSVNRPLLHHTDLLEWVNGGMQKSGVDYKVIDNVVDTNGNLFQQYLLDTEIDTPDGQSISPLMVLKASYIGKPLEVMFGTYRFVCSNGALVGNTIESFTVKPNEVADLLSRSIETEVTRGVEHMNRVSQRYSSLANEKMSDYLSELVGNKKMSSGIRKEILYSLESSGHVSLPTEDDGIEINGETLNHGDPANLFTLVNDDSGWFLYNSATFASTHTTRTASARNRADRQIASVFGV